MAIATASDRADFNRLILQIERDLLSQARLKALLTTATAATAGHRNQLRKVKTRLANARSASRRKSV